jgi:hypothetical protein
MFLLKNLMTIDKNIYFFFIMELDLLVTERIIT